MTHGWLLTAPWWHWPRQGEQGLPPDRTRPALHKYATPAFGAELLADPQRRLRFVPTDLVGGKGPRKLYQPTHHRHYLVLTELHCDAPGLPSPPADEVCERGFVVRRHSVSVPVEHEATGRGLLRQVALARARIEVLDRKIGTAGTTNGVGEARLAALRERRDRAVTGRAERERALREWAEATGFHRSLQGWIPLAAGPDGPIPLPERPAAGLAPLAGLGRWVPVPELPTELTEAAFPLYPLVADPRDPHHDVAGLTVFFGAVPTVTADLELPVPGEGGRVDRRPRFTDLDRYEIRCFVRRHDPACPRTGAPHDCHGRLHWSEPTEEYRLAAPLDPRGTAHRPVTVMMPDLSVLKAEAAGLVGMGGLRMVTPPGSQLDLPGTPSGGGTQICSFAIPLITIIAMFVMKLFLPVVVFLFQLWWLLGLKLCVPPRVNLTQDLVDALETENGRGFVENPAVRAKLATELGQQGKNLMANLTAAAQSLGISTSGEPITDKIAKSLTDDAVAPPRDRLPAVRAALASAGLSAPDDDLKYEPRVERAEVFAP